MQTLVHHHALFKALKEHLFLVVEQINVPEAVLVGGRHLVHLHQNASVVERIELFEYAHELLRIAQPPDQHPAEVGAADERDHPKLLREEPTCTPQMATADEETRWETPFRPEEKEVGTRRRRCDGSERLEDNKSRK